MSANRNSAGDKHAHIPRNVEQAMNKHLQQSLPAHLRQYASGDKYVPAHVQQQIAQHMQKTAPAHLKQYAGAYMQQKVIEPNAMRLHQPVTHSAAPPAHPQTPDKLRLGHSIPYGEQHSVAWGQMPEDQAQPQQAQPPQPAYTTAPTPPQPQVNSPQETSPYHFIMNPAQAPKRSPLAGFNSPLKRGALIVGGLIVLLILFSIFKGFLNSNSSTPYFLSVLQDQQSLLHIMTTNADQQNNMSDSNTNFTATAEVSLRSSQSDMISYMTKNGVKINPKQLVLKVNTTYDERLKTAAAATTFDETYKEIMQAQMKQYTSDLRAAYAKTSGKNGRALLSGDYKQAQLLLTVLNSDSTPPAP